MATVARSSGGRTRPRRRLAGEALKRAGERRIASLSAEIVAAMSEPGFYPHRPAAVELVETHASWVFLADALAYKLKKPVAFPFMDYGTVGRRRWMCNEEVRLNRQLSEGIYLGVQAIVREGPHLCLAEEGDPRALDYVVVMRRVPPERTVSHLSSPCTVA